MARSGELIRLFGQAIGSATYRQIDTCCHAKGNCNGLIYAIQEISADWYGERMVVRERESTRIGNGKLYAAELAALGIVRAQRDPGDWGFQRLPEQTPHGQPTIFGNMLGAYPCPAFVHPRNASALAPCAHARSSSHC